MSDRLDTTPDFPCHTLLNFQLTMQPQEQDGKQILVFAMITNDVVSYSNMRAWLASHGVEHFEQVNPDKVMWTFPIIDVHLGLALANNYKSILTN
jgi:hypothetical protein